MSGALTNVMQDGSKVFSAGADKAARMYDLATGQAQQVRSPVFALHGAHEARRLTVLLFVRSLNTTSRFDA